MQCILPKKNIMISSFDVALSGTFSSSYGYVTIDGTKYTSAQTLTVAEGTSVTVYCGASLPFLLSAATIKLNGTTVAEGTYTNGAAAAAEYTFSVTNNCSIELSQNSNNKFEVFSATITMPA